MDLSYVTGEPTEEDLNRIIKMKILDKCLQRFGYTMPWIECSRLMNQILGFSRDGIPACYPDNYTPVIEHNPEFYSTCSGVEQFIAQYTLPILQLLCLFGNVLNLLIYRLPYFEGSSSVHFLRAKALANLVFVQSRTLEVIHAWIYKSDPDFEGVYWNTRPFMITVANISGTISTWMTLLVTIETVLCVLLPFSFRQYCTRKLTMMMLLGTFAVSTALHLTFLLTHTVTTETAINTQVLENNQCWIASTYYLMQRTPLALHEIYEKVYYWTQMTVSIVLPTIAMLICSVLIVTQFTFKELGEAFSQRRKCVIRMTVTTTLSHLLLEGPALLTFGAAALKGAGSEKHNTTMCILNHANNLLSVVNATIPFFVFLACNQQFRHMALVYLRAQTECHREKKQALLAQAANRVRIGTNERSYVDQTLIAKVSNI
uniref:G-protein coupled receptors family 1 profile domain-containing protein n=1 Tax=Panagrolaimus sp. ES5 TaxID=591445 RepID=A0AC34FBE7_9BILA